MDITKLTAIEFLQALDQRDLSLSTIPDEHTLMTTLRASSPQNKERLTFELLHFAKKQLAVDWYALSALLWCASFADWINSERQCAFVVELVEILAILRQKADANEWLENKFRADHFHFCLSFALIALAKVDPERCRSLLDSLEDFADKHNLVQLMANLKVTKKKLHDSRRGGFA